MSDDSIRKLNKRDLLKELSKLVCSGDPEVVHLRADKLLLQYIDCARIAEAFNRIEKWYS